MYAFSTAIAVQTDAHKQIHLRNNVCQLPQPTIKTCSADHHLPIVCASSRLPPSEPTSQPTSVRHDTASKTRSSRRNFLALLGCTLASLPFAKRADALIKKRILAKAGPLMTLPSGVTYRDIMVGKGYSPRDGDTVAIHYSLFYKDLEVESSRESQGLAATPLGFTFGTVSGPGSIMPGINLGMDGMKVGGLRLITIPPELAYGEKGKLPLIPGNATVDFAVSLLSCKRQGTNPNIMIDPKAQLF